MDVLWMVDGWMMDGWWVDGGMDGEWMVVDGWVDRKKEEDGRERGRKEGKSVGGGVYGWDQ